MYREANCLSDGLANYVFSLSYGLHYFEFAPEHVASILSDDIHGTGRARQIFL